MHYKELHKQLINLFKSGQAYMPFSKTVAGFPLVYMNTEATNVDSAFWHLLKHIRIT